MEDVLSKVSGREEQAAAEEFFDKNFDQGKTDREEFFDKTFDQGMADREEVFDNTFGPEQAAAEEFFDKNFDPEKAAGETIDWIREFFCENGDGCNAVVAVSGGKDSSVTAALCKEALGSGRVIGVMIPNGKPYDLSDGEKLTGVLGIKHFVIDIGSACDGIMGELREKLDTEVTEQTTINLPPRLRMAVTYAVSQSNNGRVANTSNLSEDWVGYSTRYGDTAGDFSPLSHFVVQEVKAIGRVLGLPDELVDKVPDDGLSGMSDEQKLGFTYNALDKYIRTGKIDDRVTKEKIDRLHALNAFKLQLMPSFEHDGPVLAE